MILERAFQSDYLNRWNEYLNVSSPSPVAFANFVRFINQDLSLHSYTSTKIFSNAKLYGTTLREAYLSHGMLTFKIFAALKM